MCSRRTKRPSISPLLPVLLLIVQIISLSAGDQVTLIYAVNAGGEQHTDVYGVTYMKDYLKTGIVSDFGMRLPQIGRLPPEDDILCRTERYGETSFGYDIPIPDDGKYVVVMKFCEVWFNQPGEKVFDVMMNKRHVIVDDLDIFATAGYGVAHQEVVPFEVKGGVKKLLVNGKESAIKGGKIRLDFVKGEYDNPKINAFYVIKGRPEDIPPLPPLGGPAMWNGEEDEDYEWYDTSGAAELVEGYERQGGKRFRRSGPFSRDPWEDESTWEICSPLVYSSSVGLAMISIMLKLLRNV